jgi:hypothetical protein
MATYIILLAFIGLSVATVTDQIPARPEWPPQFTTKFTEVKVFPVAGDKVTNGTWYYDSVNNLQRLDRDDGYYDMLCGANGMTELMGQPCSQYNNAGALYIYYPNTDQCCYCCNDSEGCGLVKPTWMENAEYLGTLTVEN